MIRYDHFRVVIKKKEPTNQFNCDFQLTSQHFIIIDFSCFCIALDTIYV